MKNNTYEFHGDIGICYTNNGEKILFDKEDYEMVKNYCWYKSNTYVSACNQPKDNNNRGFTSNQVIMHRLIMLHDMPCCNDTSIKIDHINHSILDGEHEYIDNRKENLRITTNQQNSMNQKRRKSNTSGYTGVSWDKKRGKWRAYIKLNNHLITLGRFSNIDDAVQARKEAVQKYFGKYAYEQEE